MKKFLAVILSLVMVLSLASCNMEGGYKVNKDGSLDVSLCIEFDSQEFNNYMALESMTSGVDLGGYVYSDEEISMVLESTGVPFTTSQKNGKTVFTIAQTETVAPEDVDAEFENSGVAMSTREFIISENSETSFSDSFGVGEVDPMVAAMLGDLNVNYFVTMPEKIVCTDGKISKDGKTATWVASVDKPLNSLYVLTADSDKFVSINVNNITNKKQAKISSYEKIKSITVNGKVQTGKKIAMAEDGKYTIEVVTKHSSKTFEIIKDATAPKVKGVKNGASYTGSVKIKFSDANGIKKATLNGKKIKSGATAKTKGSNTLIVTDKAGNKTTVTFTIK